METVRVLVRVRVMDHAVRGGSRAGARVKRGWWEGVRCARENGQWVSRLRLKEAKLRKCRIRDKSQEIWDE